VKLALAAFVVPFVFVFGPELLWKGPLWKTAFTFVTAAVALIVPNVWVSLAGAALAALTLAAGRLRVAARA
jgi:TRAP-type uncharacterized transport system fused permease subunit